MPMKAVPGDVRRIASPTCYTAARRPEHPTLDLAFFRWGLLCFELTSSRNCCERSGWHFASHRQEVSHAPAWACIGYFADRTCDDHYVDARLLLPGDELDWPISDQLLEAGNVVSHRTNALP